MFAKIGEPCYRARTHCGYCGLTGRRCGRARHLIDGTTSRPSRHTVVFVLVLDGQVAQLDGGGARGRMRQWRGSIPR